MKLIHAFPVCVFDVVVETLSVVCEGLGDAPATTTAFSVMLDSWRWATDMTNMRIY